MRITLAVLIVLLVTHVHAQTSEMVVGGVHHVGLTVSKIQASEDFFTKSLGFSVVGRDREYPAVFLSNGKVLITLWRNADPDQAIEFDRKRNVGLHHLAFEVKSFPALDALHDRFNRTAGVRIEFAPEPLSGTNAKHMIIREPSGNRLEFIHQPPDAEPKGHESEAGN